MSDSRSIAVSLIFAEGNSNSSPTLLPLIPDMSDFDYFRKQVALNIGFIYPSEEMVIRYEDEGEMITMTTQAEWLLHFQELTKKDSGGEPSLLHIHRRPSSTDVDTALANDWEILSASDGSMEIELDSEDVTITLGTDLVSANDSSSEFQASATVTNSTSALADITIDGPAENQERERNDLGLETSSGTSDQSHPSPETQTLKSLSSNLSTPDLADLGSSPHDQGNMDSSPLEGPPPPYEISSDQQQDVRDQKRPDLESVPSVDSNEYLDLLMSQLVKLSGGSMLNRQSIIDCMRNDSKYNPDSAYSSDLYVLMQNQLGKRVLDELNANLRKVEDEMGNQLSLKSIIIEMYRSTQNESIISHLKKNATFFIGKMLQLTDPITGFHRMARITLAECPSRSLICNLEDQSRITLNLNLNRSEIQTVEVSSVLRFSIDTWIDWVIEQVSTCSAGFEVEIVKKQQDELSSSTSTGNLSASSSSGVFDAGKYVVSDLNNQRQRNWLKNQVQSCRSFNLISPSKHISYHIKATADKSGMVKIKVDQMKSSSSSNSSESDRSHCVLKLKDKQIHEYAISFITPNLTLRGINKNNAKDLVRISELPLGPSELKLKQLRDISNNRLQLISMLVGRPLLSKSPSLQHEYLNSILSNYILNDMKRIDLDQVNAPRDDKPLNDLLQHTSNLYALVGVSRSSSEILLDCMLQANYIRYVVKDNSTTVLQIMEILAQANQYWADLKSKELILFYGDTGSGKSTLVNFLLGIPLVQVVNDYQQKVVQIDPSMDLKGKQYATIGQSIGASETTFVQGFEVTVGAKSSNTKLTLADMPGSHDSRGDQYDLATKVSIDQVVRGATSVRAIVITIPFEAFLISKGDPVMQIFYHLLDQIPAATKSQRIKQSLFLVITKHSSQPQPANIIRNMVNAFLAAEQQQLDHVSKSDQDARSIDYIAQKIEIWKTIGELCDNSKMYILAIDDAIGRGKMLTKFMASPTVPITEFVSAMNQPEVQRKFGKVISTSFHTFVKLIAEPYQITIPKTRSRLQQSIKEAKMQIHNLGKQEEQKEQLVQVLEKGNEQLKLELSKFKQGFPSADSAEMKRIALKDERLRQINESLTSNQISIDATKINMRTLAFKKSNLIQAIDELKDEIKSLSQTISDLSKGSEERLLYHWEKRDPESSISVSSIREGKHELAFNELRPLKDEEKYAPTTVKAGTYIGQFTHLCVIESQYIVVPQEEPARSQFIKEGRVTGGTHLATITGVNFKLHLGRKVDPTGRRIVYSIETDWKYPADGNIPWFKITHTLPKRDINEAIINNRDADMRLLVLEQKEKEEKLRVADEDLEKEKETLKQLNQAKQQIEQSKAQEQKRASSELKASYEESIQLNDDSLRRTRVEILDTQAQIRSIEEKMKRDEKALNESWVKQVHFSMLIKTQLSIADLLRKFAKMQLLDASVNFSANSKKTQSNLGIAADNVHESLHKECQDYLLFYDKNINKIKEQCEKHLELFKSHILSNSPYPNEEPEANDEIKENDAKEQIESKESYGNSEEKEGTNYDIITNSEVLKTKNATPYELYSKYMEIKADNPTQLHSSIKGAGMGVNSLAVVIATPDSKFDDDADSQNKNAVLKDKVIACLNGVFGEYEFEIYFEPESPNWKFLTKGFSCCSQQTEKGFFANLRDGIEEKKGGIVITGMKPSDETEFVSNPCGNVTCIISLEDDKQFHAVTDFHVIVKYDLSDPPASDLERLIKYYEKWTDNRRLKEQEQHSFAWIVPCPHDVPECERCTFYLKDGEFGPQPNLYKLPNTFLDVAYTHPTSIYPLGHGSVHPSDHLLFSGTIAELRDMIYDKNLRIKADLDNGLILRSRAHFSTSPVKIIAPQYSPGGKLGNHLLAFRAHHLIKGDCGSLVLVPMRNPGRLLPLGTFSIFEDKSGHGYGTSIIPIFMYLADQLRPQFNRKEKEAIVFRLYHPAAAALKADYCQN